jgi:anti-anti-sigma factor
VTGAGRQFDTLTRFDDPWHLVRLSGELDTASHDAAVTACAADGHRDVVVDLSALTFLDCAGYRALDTTARILAARGGSLVLLNPTGAPRRLLALIEDREFGLCGSLRDGLPSSPAPAGVSE